MLLVVLVVSVVAVSDEVSIGIIVLITWFCTLNVSPYSGLIAKIFCGSMVPKE